MISFLFLFLFLVQTVFITCPGFPAVMSSPRPKGLQLQERQRYIQSNQMTCFVNPSSKILNTGSGCFLRKTRCEGTAHNTTSFLLLEMETGLRSIERARSPAYSGNFIHSPIAFE